MSKAVLTKSKLKRTPLRSLHSLDSLHYQLFGMTEDECKRIGTQKLLERNRRKYGTGGAE